MRLHSSRTECPLNVVKHGRFVPLTVTHETRDALPARERVSVARKALWNSQAAAATRALIDEFQPDLLHAHKLYNQLSVAPVVVASGAHSDRADLARLRVHQREPIRSPRPLAGPGRKHPLVPHFEQRGVSGSTLFTSPARIRVDLGIEICGRTPRSPWNRVDSSAQFRQWDRGEPGSGFEQRRGAVFIGRLNPQKGVQDVLALAKAEPELPITIVGAGQLGRRRQPSRLHAPQPQLRRLRRAGTCDRASTLRKGPFDAFPVAGAGANGGPRGDGGRHPGGRISKRGPR